LKRDSVRAAYSHYIWLPQKFAVGAAPTAAIVHHSLMQFVPRLINHQNELNQATQQNP
jgi:hypothetical protein